MRVLVSTPRMCVAQSQSIRESNQIVGSHAHADSMLAIRTIGFPPTLLAPETFHVQPRRDN